LRAATRATGPWQAVQNNIGIKRQYVEELAGNGKFHMQKANTAAETAAEIKALPEGVLVSHSIIESWVAR
jgi:hypothetical protein